MQAVAVDALGRSEFAPMRSADLLFKGLAAARAGAVGHGPREATTSARARLPVYDARTPCAAGQTRDDDGQVAKDKSRARGLGACRVARSAAVRRRSSCDRRCV